MNKSKRSLRSTLQELTAALTEAILAAARESLFDLADTQPAAAPRKQRVAKKPKAARARPAPALEVELVTAHAFEAASDQMITDPQALLAALDTAGPASSPREVPELLLPVETPAPELYFVPSLRAGEEIMRTSGSSVVLRRRRV